MKSGRLDRFARLFHYNLKLSGLTQPLLAALILTGVLVFAALTTPNLDYLRRVIEVVCPLAFGLHAAYLLAPENEPALELLAATPKPLGRLLVDRLLSISLVHGALALTATLVVILVWQVEDPGTALLRWVPEGIALAGVAVFASQLTRQAAFGSLLATLLWVSSLYGGDALLERWHFAWGFHLYLQPGTVAMPVYWFNRLILLLAGVILVLLGALLLRRSERTLGSQR
jgi:hypothetical protein